ncbi:hypothetical protein HAX54_039329 [Datura stramonium]|uniref:Uncharacterized protein n=1 Tax=Datura stramonium TaxID=4076 RepID=A0ABS8VMK6_DATST|nr:hypothetical protein [Datura stramonium]
MHRVAYRPSCARPGVRHRHWRRKAWCDMQTRLLSTPNVDPQPFVTIVRKPPCRDIRHTLFVALTQLQGGLATNNLGIMFHSRMLIVRPGFEETIDDDVAKE